MKTNTEYHEDLLVTRIYAKARPIHSPKRETHKHRFNFIGICKHPYLRRNIINLLFCKCGREIDGFTKEIITYEI